MITSGKGKILSSIFESNSVSDIVEKNVVAIGSTFFFVLIVPFFYPFFRS